MILLSFLVLACNEIKSEDTGATSEPSNDQVNEEINTEESTQDEESDLENIETVSCANISIESCGEYAECEIVYAQMMVYNEDAECTDFDASEPVACAPFGCSAEPTVTFAKPYDVSECWMIPSGCLPEEWTTCEAGIQQNCP